MCLSLDAVKYFQIPREIFDKNSFPHTFLADYGMPAFARYNDITRMCKLPEAVALMAFVNTVTSFWRKQSRKKVRAKSYLIQTASLQFFSNSLNGGMHFSSKRLKLIHNG